MSTRSEHHQCEVCGIHGFHGRRQWDGSYLWYCFDHFHPAPLPAPPQQQEAAPEPAPLESPLPAQGDLLAGSSVDREAAWARYRDGGYSWAKKFEAFILYQVPPGAVGGPGGETFRFQAEKIIGPHSGDGKIVGSVIQSLRVGGFVEGAGEWARPRDPKSKGSKKEVVRRTSRQ
jgi:hypothetical protein